MDLGLSMPFSQAVKILIQVLEYMLVLTIHTLNLLNYSIRLLRSTTVTDLQLNIHQIWTQVGLSAQLGH